MNKAPVEIERKYIIEKPDIEKMQSLSKYRSAEIVQIYLDSPAGITHRVRKMQFSDKTVYTETKKVRIDKISAFEDEHEIEKFRFDELILSKKDGTESIIKTRHTFEYGSQIFEIDIYPAWHNICIMETELSDREKKVEMPDFIKIKAEVSGVRAFSNAALAADFPNEESIKF